MVVNKSKSYYYLHVWTEGCIHVFNKSYDYLHVWTEGCIQVFNKSYDHLQVWTEGCVQVFYSLGPTWGGIHTMASYNRFSNSCLKSV